MSVLKSLVAVTVVCLAGTASSALAAERFSCPELPANSGLEWVNANLMTSPVVRDPTWCDAEDIRSGKVIFVIWFTQYRYGTNVAITGGRRGYDEGKGVIAGRQVEWHTPVSTAYTSRSNPIAGPFRAESADIRLANGTLMNVTVTATGAEGKQRALNVLARMRLPNQN